MTNRVVLIVGLVLALGGCDGGSATHTSNSLEAHSPHWEPVAPGMVLTRNFMVPGFLERQSLISLPKNYHLGSKAYAKAPPDWWLSMIKNVAISDKWHPKDFPLAYAGELKAKDGSVVLLIVQASQAFTGDGFLSPGPEIYLVARIFSLQPNGAKLLREENYNIGSMQYCRLLAGETRGNSIIFQVEGGSDFDSQKVSYKKTWTLNISGENNLSMAKGDTVFLE